MAARQAGCYSPGYSGGAGPGPPGVSGPVSGSAARRVTLCGDVRSGAVGRRGTPGAAPPGVRSGAGLRGAARPWCLPRRGRSHTPDYRREMPGPFGSHLIKRQGTERGPKGAACFRFPVYQGCDFPLCWPLVCVRGGGEGVAGGRKPDRPGGDCARCLAGGRGRRPPRPPRRTANGERRTANSERGPASRHLVTGTLRHPPPGRKSSRGKERRSAMHRRRKYGRARRGWRGRRG